MEGKLKCPDGWEFVPTGTRAGARHGTGMKCKIKNTDIFSQRKYSSNNSILLKAFLFCVNMVR